MYEAVKEFREKMGLPIGKKPQFLSPAEVSYFARFIMEELSEFLRANEEESLVNAADALVDLTYVTLGLSHAMGLPFEKLFTIVHRANMSKEPASELYRSTRGNQYDVIKPLGWQKPEPEMLKVLQKLNIRLVK